MSTSVFPSLPGLTYNITRTPMWKTTTQENISGKEFRVALMTYPRYQWDIAFSILRSASAYTEFQTLMGFYNARQGSFDSFLYSDPDDNSVAGQTIATASGSQSAFQLIRTLGGFVEPVLAPHTVSAVYLNGVSTPSTPISPPSAPFLTPVISGFLPATNYYVKITYVAGGAETSASSESSITMPMHQVVYVQSPAAATGATGWNVYVSNSSGGSGAETKQNATPIAIGTDWQEPNSGLIAGTTPPATNLTGWSITGWGASTPGVLTFGGNITSGVVITADFTYYWPCRFVDDKIGFNLFMNQMYDLKKLSFISVKS